MSATIHGMQELAPALTALERKVRGKVIRRGLRAGAKVTFAGARGTIPVLSGLSLAALKVRSGRARRGSLAINVGVGTKDFTGPTYYFAFNDLGHRIGPRRLGDKRKKVPAENSIKYAYEETKDAALNAVITTLTTEIEAATKEAARGDQSA